MEDALGMWVNAFVQAVVKLLIWTLPAVLLIRYFQKDMWLSLKEMFTTKVKWRPYIAMAAGFIVWSLFNGYRRFGRIGVHEDFEMVSLIGVVLVVGVTEEVVFRGWLLGAALKKIPYWPAVLTNALLFVLIHVPRWIQTGQFENLWIALGNCASIFALSVLFAWAFTKSKNLFVPIVLHMIWNLGVILFMSST